MFTHRALRGSWELIETCLCVPDRIWIWKCWFLRRGETWSTLTKPSRSKGRNQQQTQPTYGIDAEIWTQATLVHISAGRVLSSLCQPYSPGGNFEHVLPCNSYCIFSFSLPYLLINFMLKPTKTKFISHSYFTTQKRGEVIMSCCYGSKISGSQQTMGKKGKCFELSPYWEMFGSQLELLLLLSLFLLLLLVELKWIFNQN